MNVSNYCLLFHNCYIIDFFSVDTYSADTLTFVKLDRRQMGAYLCIASNDVPPAVSKRITLNVNCESIILASLLSNKQFYIIIV